ncbi:MAG: M6 family metalloprotease domain-containing protein [Candidatus Cloacimonetes bacterium]|jgi:M6 family metalloprotease-like protein|nr:M6 family metalloprotease domain-containing protein [Candidatus Cloacimonadota bacterium]MDD2507043.1 M6 family metalloprotease domain-containing protein [Candidatus Cloacimonadota bacterium]MDD4146981.1 M6 family metalloprotease domain-containing protein [Candidatus Cloacimonadota bacterium]MDD4560360.1 M6 family metalloprotease domain-containing protein [Candidatus Cloacimonadota bacterium]
MRRNLLLLLITLFIAGLAAAPHSFLPVPAEQPDGSKIEIFASGDEFHNWLHDKDNYSIVRDDKGYYVYAAQDGENVAPTNLVVGRDNPARLSIDKGVNLSKNLIRKKYERLSNMRDYTNAKSPHVGSFHNLVIFIRFSDSPQFMRPITYYDDMFNNDSQNYNSMKNYFLAASYGQLSVDSFFFPESDGTTIVSYVDSHPRGYYSPYNSSNPKGYDPDDYWQRTEREHTLLADASAFVADQIPDTIDVDGDDDGYVDNVCFIIQGTTDGWAELLWPHRWVLYGANAYIQGAQVWDFNFQLENSLNSSGASVLAHEMFHSLGAPDLYRYETTDITPIGSWDLMANNANPPQHMSAWMKYRYGQWLPNPPVITESGSYSLQPVASSSDNNIYLVNSWNNENKYVLEYRKPHGLYDGNLPDYGLVVYRLYQAIEGNADGPPDELYIYRPLANNNSTNGQLYQAAMSADSGRTRLTEYTIPSGFTTWNLPGGLYLYNVGTMGESISFDLRITDIQLTSPQSNVTWFSGSSKQITWVSRNSNGTVKIEFSSDGGTNWEVLANGVPNNGSYTLAEVPELDSDNCIIKLSLNTNGHWDQSFTPFTIVSQIAVPTLIYPGQESEGMPTNPNFQWQNVAGATSYNFQLSEDPYFSAMGISVLNHTANEYQASGLTPFTTYYWRVATVSEVGTGEYSSVFSFSTGALSEMPAKPQLLSPANFSYNQALDPELSWTPSYLAESYWLQIATNPFFGTPIFEVEYVTDTSLVPNILPANSVIYWRVAARNSFSVSGFSNAFRFSTGNWMDNDDNQNPALQTVLKPNYPNPFNPETTISFSLSDPNSETRLRIYNTKGQLLRELYRGIPGTPQMSLVWDGRDDEGRELGSGIYLYRLETGNEVQTRKMILSK